MRGLTTLLLALTCLAAHADRREHFEILRLDQGNVHFIHVNESIDSVISRYFPDRSADWPNIEDAIRQLNPNVSIGRADQALPVGESLFLPSFFMPPKIGSLRTGTLTARNAAGQLDVLTEGDALRAGDTLIGTGPGLARVQLDDGTGVTIWPGAELSLDEVVRSPRESVVKRLKGTLEAGRIRVYGDGETEHRFSLQMQSTHLGVRGTDFGARICEAGSCDFDGKKVEDGDLLGLLEGALDLTSGSNELSVDPGNVYLVDSPASVPAERPDLAGLLYGPDEWKFGAKPRCFRAARPGRAISRRSNCGVAENP